jgi:murein DD-endopeptidase MepM/ murein hydrolase activator NlpD
MHPSRSSRLKYALMCSVAAAGVIAVAGCGVVSRGSQPPAQVLNYGTQSPARYGVVTAQAGDTAWRIAQRYNIPLRDLIDINQFQPPYMIAEGHRIVLPPPVEHRAGANDTLNSLSRMYDVPVSQLVRINKISPPYKLAVGQVIRMPSRAAMMANQQVSDMLAEEMPNSMPQRKPVVVQKVELAGVGRRAAGDRAQVRVQEAPQQTITTTLAPSTRGGFTWPVRGQVISTYGPKAGQLYNDGINIAAPKGTPVVSASDGVVAYVGDDLSSYGNLVLIRHAGGMVTAYAHLGSVSVKKGTRVKRGQPIGTVGNTGKVANSQLHFEIRRGTDTLDPQKFLG